METVKKYSAVILAFCLILGISGMGFAAANPFVDVPAKHWAYDAVGQLVQAGVLEGYGGSRYFGVRPATRYELAQITAQAMSRADKAGAGAKALINPHLLT